MKKPLIPVACSYALGIALASVIQIPAPSPLLWFAFASLLLVVLWVFARSRPSMPSTLTVLILLAFFLLGILYYQRHAHPLSPTHLANIPGTFLNRPSLIEGTLCTPPETLPQEIEEGKTPPPMSLNPKKLRIILDQIVIFQGDRGIPLQGKIRATLRGDPDQFGYGERIRLQVQLERPRGYLNPGAFCLTRYLIAEGVYLEGRVNPHEVPMHLGRPEEPTILGRLYDFRGRMLEGASAHVIGPNLGVLQAITLGERSLLDENTKQDFVRSGTFHVLAISGLNVSMVAAILYYLLRILRFPLRARAGLTIVWVACYAVLAGGGASVVRAAIMTTVFLAALILEREADLANTVALSALLILLWNPFQLLEPGFQLTFGATLGILILMEAFPLNHLTRPLRWLLTCLLVSLAATLATLPILAHHFHRASWVGVLANVTIVPLSGAITALGLLFAGLSIFDFPGLPGLAQLLQVLIAQMMRQAHFFASWPGASFLIYGPSPAMICLYFGVLIPGLKWRRGRWFQIASLLSVFLMLSLIATKVYVRSHRMDLRVTFLDVGQGDCTLLELPAKGAILIDGGGSRQGHFDVGEQVVRNYLLHRWVGRLDRMILSHPHPDHLRGLLVILRDFPVGEIWTGGDPLHSPFYCELGSLANRKRVRIRQLKARDRPEPAAPLQAEVLHPSAKLIRGSPRGDFSDVNNNSLVLKISYGQIRFLFPGDIEAEAEGQILRKKDFDLAAEIIKIPHHGGRSSSTPPFIRAVRPRFAVASAGSSNPFGHPSPETVQRFEKTGTRVLSTAGEGAVIIVTDGRDLLVSTASAQRRRPPRVLSDFLGIE